MQHPRAAAGSVSLTWVGHATFLVQLGGVNVLTDPHFARRASPVQWAGPKRMAGLPLDVDDLPAIDLVVLSHDHYDHLDATSVKRLARRFPDATWVSPLGYDRWLRARGVLDVVEADWWHERSVDDVTLTCLPVQHWCRRGFRANERLWGGWSLQSPSGSVLFVGDSGYFHGFREIGARLAPFDAVLMPIGAYEPRWFMRPAHMNPEEAVQAYRDLGGEGVMAGMHWGTFRLTDEDPLEPPGRTRSAWDAEGLDPDRLWIPRHGETRWLRTSESPVER